MSFLGRSRGLTALLAIAMVAGFALSLLVASASALPVQTEGLEAETENVAMCDDTVTITPIELLGVVVTVTVSDIATQCNGWRLKVQVTNSSNVPAATQLTTIVDATSEAFLSLSITAFPGPARYYFVFEPPA